MEINTDSSLQNVNFIEPQKIIDSSGIKEGDVVADFGCGPGYFSIPLSKIVGEDGAIFAFDVLPSALESLQSQIKLQGLSNISTKRVNLEQGTGLEDISVDWVIIKDVLFQNGNKKAILQEAYRILKSDGKIILIEWRKDGPPMGPKNDLRLSLDILKKLLTETGFVDNSDLDAGDYHYALTATKKQ